MTKKKIAEIEKSLAVLGALLTPLELMLKQVNYERSNLFPLGSVVHVNHPRYTGHAIVSAYPNAPQLLEVRLENSNRWEYPLSSIAPEQYPNLYPEWIKRDMCKRRGKHAWKKAA